MELTDQEVARRERDQAGRVGGPGSLSEMGDAVAACFSDLGAGVSRLWSEGGRRPEGLSAAATSALLQLPPYPDLGAVSILEHALRNPDLPARQSRLSDIFGQPPLVLFAAPDFLIQALTWAAGPAVRSRCSLGGDDGQASPHRK